MLAIINAAINVDTMFTSRTQSMQEGTFDIIKMKRKYKPYLVTVKEPSMRVTTIHESIFKRSDEQNSCRAQVTVLTSPVTDVNFSRCLKYVQITYPKRFPRSIKNVPQQAYIVEENNMGQKVKNEVNCASDQLLSLKFDTDEALSENDELIFSDRSKLGKYVKYKHGKVKRMRSEPAEFNDRESSYSMAASELMRACAVNNYIISIKYLLILNLVRILEPTRQVPYITAPSRSRLGSVEMETISSPIRMHGENKFGLAIQRMQKWRNFRSERSMSLTKPSFEFDMPLSPFEQTLQNQAFQLRRISTICDNDNDNDGDDDDNIPVIQVLFNLIIIKIMNAI
ncbi:unnamed protein product [Brugia timori]|uniref:Uncharacterized protein n=1 Tax=Brugia timori TaxID=42155 RepID=A0A3P7WVW9_9BILA|nr:unnamed protein product [Brugia timori]